MPGKYRRDAGTLTASGPSRNMPASRSSTAPNTLGESKRGRHSHSTFPLGATSAHVVQSDRKPYSAMGGNGLALTYGSRCRAQLGHDIRVGVGRWQRLRYAVVGSSAAVALLTVPISGDGAVNRVQTLVAVGDIASCEVTADEAVAELVARTPGTLALLGDTVYDNGTLDEYRRCFLPRWGRFLPRTRAALGNHEYANGASDAADSKSVLGLPDDGWYSYELGAWHVIVLNSNCDAVGGCERNSRQWRWLQADLTRKRATRCVLAYWHHARFSSGEHGSDVRYAPFWDMLAASRADVVLSAHDHDYERFAPLKGIRSFVVGTGGRSQRGFGAARPGSAVRQTGTYGVLRLSLRPDGYAWAFLRATGEPFADAGTGRCR